MSLRIPFLICLLWLGSVVPALAGVESDWRIEARPGYAWLNRQGIDAEGPTVGMMGGWRTFDTLFLKLDVELAFLDIYDASKDNIYALSIGVNYDLDVLPVLPTLGTGVGPTWMEDPFSGDLKMEWSWHLLLGASYFITDNIGVGGELKYNFIFSEFNQDPIFFVLAAKLLITI